MKGSPRLLSSVGRIELLSTGKNWACLGAGCFCHSKLGERCKGSKPWRPQVTAFAMLEGGGKGRGKVAFAGTHHYPWPMPNILQQWLQQEAHLDRALASLMWITKHRTFSFLKESFAVVTTSSPVLSQPHSELAFFCRTIKYFSGNEWDRVIPLQFLSVCHSSAIPLLVKYFRSCYWI